MSGIYRGPKGSATADALNIEGDKGDLTISNSGLEWTINPDTVDFSKMQNISTNTVLGRATAGTGDVEEITCTAAGRALLDDANAAAQRTTLGLGNAATATIGTEVLAYDSNLQAFVNTFTLPTVDSTNGFVLTTNGTGTLSLTAPGEITDADYGDITVATGGTVWTIDNNAVTTVKILDDNVTYAKIQNVSATDKLLGRSTAGAGDIEEITCTSAGRALLDDADASAQRSTLGLGSLATLSAVTNTELANQYINNLTSVTAAAGDYVAIADTSDSGNKKKTLVSDIVALATTTFASGAEFVTGTDTTKALNSAVVRNNNIINATTQLTTSGTAKDFTGIPAWAKEITIMFDQVGTNGISDFLIQLGDAGGIENTGYVGGSTHTSSASATLSFTAGFGISTLAQGGSIQGRMVISLLNAPTFKWSESGTFVAPGPLRGFTSAGTKALSAALDRVRITTVNGTDTFNEGSISVSWK